MKLKIILIALFANLCIYAQSVSGVVKSGDNQPIPGANVLVKGTSKGVTTDFDGKFTIAATSDQTLIFSSIGFETKEEKVGSRKSINVVLNEEAQKLEDVVVMGSRKKGRASLDTPVAVDIINISSQAAATPQTDLTQILNYAAPSFTSNTTTIADGTDHIDPAQLRGLGPDQVLVLLNGKRRHTTSLVNVNGSPGRGSVGTDLNAIPSFAIERLEVLRDGAAAQYGSDAIAGVININMKKGTEKLEVSYVAGGHASKGANDNTGGVDGIKHQLDLNYGFKIKDKGFVNLTGSLQKRDQTSRAGTATGSIFNGYHAVEKRALNNGVNISSLFGNIVFTPNQSTIINHIKNFAPQVNYFTAAKQLEIQNASTLTAMQTALNFDVSDQEVAYRGLTRKDFNMRVGQSELVAGQFFLNSEYEISSRLKLYAFGGYSYRNGNSAGFYRRPNQNRAATSIYENGHLPEITSDVKDASFAYGFRGKLGEFDYDFSNTLGKNTFDYTVTNSANASLPFPSKKEFDAGSLKFFQNTMNLDFTRKFEFLKGLNIAFGGEYRYENYIIRPGEEASYALYDINGNVQTPTTAAALKPTDFFGAARPGGAQVFPGFRPENNTNRSRSSAAAYLDTELDVTDKWLVSAAVRFENYSDFGSTFNYKIATRYKITDNFVLRGAHSTGFRAPSLAQIYFNSTSTQTIGGVVFQVGTFSNDHPLTKGLGIQSLKEEESKSYSAGFTAKLPEQNLSFTVDAFRIDIDDRVIMTDRFSPNASNQFIYDQAGATAGTFFTNAISTKTQGLEAVISHKIELGKANLSSDLAFTYNETRRVGDIKNSDKLTSPADINNYFSEMSRVYLEEAVPRMKASLNNNLAIGKLNVFLRNAYFGAVTDPNSTDVNNNGQIDGSILNGLAIQNEHPIYSGKVITDLSFGYKILESLKLTVGANNLFDIYPDLNIGPKTVKTPNGVSNGNVTYTPGTSVVDLSNQDQFIYPRNVSQFGQNGRFVFARVNFTF